MTNSYMLSENFFRFFLAKRRPICSTGYCDNRNGRTVELIRYARRLGLVLRAVLKVRNVLGVPKSLPRCSFHPKEFLQLVPAVNSVLAGSEQQLPEVRWRLWIFDFLVFLQKRFAMIAPRMSLQPK